MIRLGPQTPGNWLLREPGQCEAEAGRNAAAVRLVRFNFDARPALRLEFPGNSSQRLNL